LCRNLLLHVALGPMIVDIPVLGDIRMQFRILGLTSDCLQVHSNSCDKPAMRVSSKHAKRGETLYCPLSESELAATVRYAHLLCISESPVLSRTNSHVFISQLE